jgi:hypothetical protein
MNIEEQWNLSILNNEYRGTMEPGQSPFIFSKQMNNIIDLNWTKVHRWQRTGVQIKQLTLQRFKTFGCHLMLIFVTFTFLGQHKS